MQLSCAPCDANAIDSDLDADGGEGVEIAETGKHSEKLHRSRNERSNSERSNTATSSTAPLNTEVDHGTHSAAGADSDAAKGAARPPVCVCVCVCVYSF